MCCWEGGLVGGGRAVKGETRAWGKWQGVEERTGLTEGAKQQYTHSWVVRKNENLPIDTETV